MNDLVAIRDLARFAGLPARFGAMTNRSTVIERTRLDEHFAAATGKLIRVLAPAGYGKSTLISRWVGSDPRERSVARPRTDRQRSHGSRPYPEPSIVRAGALGTGRNPEGRHRRPGCGMHRTIRPGVGRRPSHREPSVSGAPRARHREPSLAIHARPRRPGLPPLWSHRQVPARPGRHRPVRRRPRVSTWRRPRSCSPRWESSRTSTHWRRSRTSSRGGQRDFVWQGSSWPAEPTALRPR